MSKPVKPELTKVELQHLVNIVSTHPTPTGVGSQEGKVKIGLVNKLSQMIDGFNDVKKENTPTQTKKG